MSIEFILWVSELIVWVSELILWVSGGGGGGGGGDGSDDGDVPTTLPSGQSPDPSRPGTKYPVQESLTSTCLQPNLVEWNRVIEEEEEGIQT